MHHTKIMRAALRGCEGEGVEAASTAEEADGECP